MYSCVSNSEVSHVLTLLLDNSVTLQTCLRRETLFFYTTKTTLRCRQLSSVTCTLVFSFLKCHMYSLLFYTTQTTLSCRQLSSVTHELFTYMTLHILVCGTTCEKSLVWQDGDLFKCATLLSYSHGVVQMCDKRLWYVVKMKMNFHGKLFKCATNDSGMLFKWEYTVHGELFKCAIHASGCCSNANAVSWKVIQTCDDWLWMLFKCKYTLMESCSNVRCYSCSLVKLFKRATNDSGCCSNESTLSWRCSNMRQTTLHVVQMKTNSHGRIQIRDKRLWMLFKWKSTLMESRWNARDAIGWLWPLQICTTHSELHSAPNGRNWHMNESCNCAQLEMSYCPTVFPCHVVHMSWANVWCYSFIRYHV